MKKVIFFVAFIFLASINGYSEPSKTIQFLMDDPVSMLDWGMFQMEKFGEDCLNDNIVEIVASDLSISKNKIHVGNGVNYNWDSNLINFWFILSIDFHSKDKLNTFDVESIKSVGKKIIDRINTYREYFFNYFEHVGFKTKNNTTDVEKEIPNLIQTHIKINFIDKNKKKRRILVENRFNTDRIFFSEEPLK